MLVKDVIQTIVLWLANERNIRPEGINRKERLAQVGLDSLGVVKLAAELSKSTGRTISPTLLWECPSIEALARAVAAPPALEKPAISASNGAASRVQEEQAIAIVGMACRVPGAPSVEAFWKLIAEGGFAIGEPSAARRALSHALPALTDDETKRIERAGYVEQIEAFDPLFFGISPREAAAMDPQQRLALELCWEALENAAIPPAKLQGSKTGVFAAAIWSDYAMLMDRTGPDSIDHYSVTGWQHSIIANRISYILGLNGPSLAVDAACASGLAIVHLAMQCLLRGECEMAIVPAVNLNILPESSLGVLRFGGLSKSGACRTFDAKADGYVRGEGGGVVLLKPLAKAIADGNRIHAVIRGGAWNNDGASNGLTAPNPAAQRSLLKDAYANAGVDPLDLDYVEAHGTGTPLGDPIEASAIGAILGQGRANDSRLWVGSVKTNIGHLEGAAGIAGLLKVVLMLKHRAIPKSLHFETPNPLIPFADLGIDVPTGLVSIPPREKRMLAGVSAFGLGGTNTHLVVEEWPQSLDAMVLERRASGVSMNAEEPSSGIVFVCPGQGSQWAGMARWLIQAEPVFRDVIEQCDPHVRRLLGYSLMEELCGAPPRARLDQIEVSLPAIIAIDIAMAALLRSRGIRPSAVIGHSTGEIAAAHIAGALDLEQTMQVICAYGKQTARFSGRGAMALVELDWQSAERAISGLSGRIYCAIEDSCKTTVLAGEPEALEDAIAQLQERGVVCRRVSMNVAPHCPLVDIARGDLAADLASIRPQKTSIPLISEVTGEEAPGETLDAAHWVKNFGDAAHFSRAVDALIARGYRTFVDLGPHPITRYSIETNLRAAGVSGTVHGCMLRKEETPRALLDTMERLSAHGHSEPEPLVRRMLLPMTAKSEQSLFCLAESYALALREKRASVEDMVKTASLGRLHFEHRLAVTGSSAEEMQAALVGYLEHDKAASAVSGRAPNAAPRLVFVFPGQGAQSVGMARGLLAEPVFRRAIEQCDAAIQREAGFSVLAELWADAETSRLVEIDVVQPVLFSISVALAALFRSLGVEPKTVIGHSLGEIAATHVAGALSLSDAVQLVCRRSRLLRRLSGTGGMAVVELSQAEAEREIADEAGRLSVSVSNGPRTTVIGGDLEALDRTLNRLQEKGIFCRRVNADVASHSPHMDVLREDLLAALKDLSPQPCEVEICSTVTASLIPGESITGDYWVGNLRQTVRFSEALRGLIAGGQTVFLEMSPHPVLSVAVEENLRDLRAEGYAVAALRRGREEWSCVLDVLSALWVRGVSIEWSRLAPRAAHFVDLPAYPFQRERYWLETSHRARPSATPAHLANAAFVEGRALLGSALSLASHPEDRIWERVLDLAALEYLRDHCVDGEIVFPGAAFVEMALEAATECFQANTLELRDVRFEQMLAFAQGARPVVQISIADQRGLEGAPWVIASRGEISNVFVRHASGRAHARRDGALFDSNWKSEIERLSRLGEHRTRGRHLEAMRRARIDFGPTFQGLVEAWVWGDEALSRIRLPESVSEEGYCAHPAWLDACLQTSALLFLSEDSTEPSLPLRIQRVCFAGKAVREAWALVKERKDGSAKGEERAFDLWILTEEGELLATIEGLCIRALQREVAEKKSVLQEYGLLTAMRATESLPALAAVMDQGGAWLVFLDSHGAADSLVQTLRRKGQRCIEVVHGASFERLSQDRYSLRMTSAEDCEALSKALLGNDEPIRAAIHCMGLDAPGLSPNSVLAADVSDGSLSAALLAGALWRQGARDVPRLFLLTRGAVQTSKKDAVSISAAPLLGLGKAISIEHPELLCKRIDLSPKPLEDELDLVCRELFSDDREEIVALRGDGRFVARLVRADLTQPLAQESARLVPADGRAFRLQIPKPGAIEHVELVEMAIPSPGLGEVVIEVEAAGLNFRDVLMALGVLRSDETQAQADGPALGGECAGRIVAVGEGASGFVEGDEVVALCTRALGSYVCARAALVVKKPPMLTFAQAATFPVVFASALYSLRDVARLSPGERVLIHAGTGGVGLAAIQWAKHVGAEIFATAGSEEKRAYLRGLGITHVFDSRSASFADEILRVTEGEGIDVVLSSSSGELAAANIRVLRDCGRFVELGRRDAADGKSLQLRPFLRSLSFSLVELLVVMEKRPALVRGLLLEILDMFATGVLSPLPITSFPISRSVEAFTYLARANHIGKVALGLKDSHAEIVCSMPDAAKAIRPDATYLITGGLGGLGFALAKGLVERGARSLVLVGRRAADADTQSAIEALGRVSDAPIDVRYAQADIAQSEEVAAIFALIRSMGKPLSGIVHAAAVLDDHVLLEQTAESFRAVFEPKALGAWHLHCQSVEHPLDFFVLYSSVAALLGSPGQSNYCAANAFLDALAEERARLGLPSLSIQWGAFAEVGLAAASEKRGARLAARGIQSFSPNEGIEALFGLLSRGRPVVSVARFDPRLWREFFPSTATSPFYSEMRGLERRAGAAEANRSGLLGELSGLSGPAQLARLEQHIVEQLKAVLRMDASKIERTAPFQSMGMDSLLSLELRNRLEASLGVRLSATTLFTHATVTALAAHLLPQAAIVAPSLAIARKQKVTLPPADPREKARPQRHEPIAVVGMACRFPGGASTPEAYWAALERGVDGVKRVTPIRWDASELPQDKPQTQWAALIDDVERADAAFFGIAPREARLLDPQQRLLLEVTWEALERACIAPEKLLGSKAGVYVGICSGDYASLIRKHGAIDAYTATGNLFSTASGRISYTLGTMGPSMTIDTACSSSLVTVHLGVQALHTGEVDLAICGGVNLLLDPAGMQLVAELQALSPEGRCKTFDAEARGIVRGEGCGMVLLKRLSDAERDGDSILAVIRGSVVNQDGRTSGLSVPNVLSQQAMLRDALADAGLRADEVGYVETHGTGTSLGDPIELEAIREVLGKPRASQKPCYLGAVKTNFGHLESAAGIAGFIKAVLCLQNNAIPKNLHFKTLNPRVSFEGTCLAIPTSKIPWPKTDSPRRAGVSSFGISGTNAHLLLEEAPSPRTIAQPARVGEDEGFVVPISAKSQSALLALLRAYHASVGTMDATLASIARAAAVGRSHFPSRVACTGRSKEELAEGLGKLVSELESSNFSTATPAERPLQVSLGIAPIGALHPSTWEWLQRRPAFSEALHDCDAILQKELGLHVWDEIDAIASRAGALEEAEDARLSFAFALACIALWRSFGVQPVELVGASQWPGLALYARGEISAADAARTICGGPNAIEEHASSISPPDSAFPLALSLSPLGADGPKGEAGFLEAIAQLYVRGASLQWEQIYPHKEPVAVLPTYPFQRERYWFTQMKTDQAESTQGAGDGSADLESRVLACVARVLRAEPSSVDKNASFLSLGMDSLMSLDLRNRLEASLEQRISAAALLKHNSVNALVSLLSQAQPQGAIAVVASTKQPERAESKLNRAFMTGATGFLGIHLLRQIMEATEERVYCLVRAENEEAALRRLRSTMRFYCRDINVDWSKVVPLLGDLGKPSLGLSQERLRTLVGEIDAVYSNGAMVDFLLSAAQIEPVNVGSLRALTELIFEKKPSVRIHHISTVAVIGEGHPLVEGRFAEVPASPEGRILIRSGYGETKRLAELWLQGARTRGAHATVYRPAVIAGDTVRGVWNTDDAVCRVLKGCVQCGYAPDFDWRPNIVPVDFVAKAIRLLSQKAETDGQVFHVTSARATPWSELVELLRDRGYRIATLSFEGWLSKIEAQGKGNAAFPFLEWFRRERPFLPIEYDCSNLRAGLKDSALEVPVATPALLNLYINQLVQAESLPPPAEHAAPLAT